MKPTYAYYTELMEGKRYLDETQLVWFNPDLEDLATAKSLLAAYGVDDLFRKSTSLSNFKTLAPDVCKELVTSEDLYYALKNGFITDEIHPKLLYYVKKLFMTNKCASTIVQALPQSLYEKVFTLGYLKNGWTMADVIRKFCCKDFKVLKEIGDYFPTQYGVEFLADPAYNKTPVLFFPKEYSDQHDFSKFSVEGPNLFDENDVLVGEMR